MTREEELRSAVAQPLEPPPATRRSLRDWTEKRRSSAVEALRYTRFVRLMKRVLPIAAVALLASVVAYSIIPRPQDKLSVTMQQSGNLANDLTMTKPRFTGTDGKGNPFTVTAAEAIQDPNDRHHAELRHVEADMQFDSQNWLNATAANGAFDIDAGTLKLTGGISLFTDSGYELHTESADVYLKTNIFKGAEKVTGHGPLGKISADRFYFDRLKKQVKLSGHVHMVMYPKRTDRR
jgi:lipopolysaccharide export system protein LptC